MVAMPTSRPAIHPGEMLLEEFLKPLALTQVALAEAIGVSLVRVNELVKGKRGITPDTALRLGRYFNTSAQLWLNLQQTWDLAQAERSVENVRALRRIKPLPVRADGGLRRVGTK
jgi:addiction module HigA family antidote